MRIFSRPLRRRPLRKLLIGAVAVATLGVTAFGVTQRTEPAAAAASSLPSGFSDQTVASGLAAPVSMSFAPDGRLFVAEKFGKVRIIKNGVLQPTPFATIQVNAEYEQGLIGVEVDPQFATNRHVYITYTKPDGNFNRVSRITASAANPDVMQAGSELVLIENLDSRGSGIHQVGVPQIQGDLLYIPVGDNGSNPATPAGTAQNLKKLNGKILRVKTDGMIPADNPYRGAGTVRCTNAPDNTAGNCQEIFALGVRNPFTMTMHPGTGLFYMNDVGNDTWEEINQLAPAKNYGWPNCEGSKGDCSNPAFTPPIYKYHHTDPNQSGGVTGKSIAGSAFYTGNVYPADFQNDYFFGDYVNGFIKRLDQTTKQPTHVASGIDGIVSLEVGPDGLLYYIDLDVNTGSGEVHKLNYGQPTGGGGSNVIKLYASGTAAGGVYPTAELLIDDQVVKQFPNIAGNRTQFSEYSYTHPTAVAASRIKIRYINDQALPAPAAGEDRNLEVDRLNVGGVDYQTEDPSVISTGIYRPATGCGTAGKYQDPVLSCNGYFAYGGVTQAPSATIDTPVPNATFKAGDTINYSGSATDPEDGTLGADKFSWNVVFHHDTHTHPFLGPFNNTKSGNFQIPTNGETAANVYYRITLTVTDSSGQKTVVARDIYPQTVDITLQTSPAGGEISLDGQPGPTPRTVKGVVNFQRTLAAPAPQAINGQSYEFANWSDGEAREHVINTPAANTTYTANYRVVGSATSGPTVIKSYLGGTLAAGAGPNAELLIDDQVVATYTNVQGEPLHGSFTEYSYTHPSGVAPGRIKIRFSNDLRTEAGEDRNLYVDKINVNGVDFQTEDPAVYSTGTYTADTGCAPGNKKSDVLSCNGFFQYAGNTVPGTSSGTRTALYRMYHPGTQDHFYTTDVGEKDAAVRLHGYRDEGPAAYVLREGGNGAQAFYRMYSPGLQKHFYTADVAERDAAVNIHKFRDEGVSSYIHYPAQAAGSVGFHRLFKPSTGQHFYTTSDSERDFVVQRLGFKSENEAGYVFLGL